MPHKANPISTDEESLVQLFTFLKEKLALSDEECEAWKTEFLQRPDAEKAITDLVESAPESVRQRFPRFTKSFLRFYVLSLMSPRVNPR